MRKPVSRAAAAAKDRQEADVVDWLRKAVDLGDGGMEGERRHAEAADEIERLRTRLAAAERVCRALTYNPPLKLTGARKEAYQAWRELTDAD